VKYGDVRLTDEQQFSVYNFEAADVEKTWKHFDLCEAECLQILNITFQYACDSSSVEWSWADFRVAISPTKSILVVAGRSLARGLDPGKVFEFWPVLDIDSGELRFTRERPKQGSTELVLSKGPLTAATTSQGTGGGGFFIPNPLPASVLGAYDLCLKCSHYFNILDARGAISVTERVGVIARVRALAVGVAKAWVDQQYGSPKKGDRAHQPTQSANKGKKEKLAPVGS
jgi:hypothetical protein